MFVHVVHRFMSLKSSIQEILIADSDPDGSTLFRVIYVEDPSNLHSAIEIFSRLSKTLSSTVLYASYFIKMLQAVFWIRDIFLRILLYCLRFVLALRRVYPPLWKILFGTSVQYLW